MLNTLIQNGKDDDYNLVIGDNYEMPIKKQ